MRTQTCALNFRAVKPRILGSAIFNCSYVCAHCCRVHHPLCAVSPTAPVQRLARGAAHAHRQCTRTSSQLHRGSPRMRKICIVVKKIGLSCKVTLLNQHPAPSRPLQEKAIRILIFRQFLATSYFSTSSRTCPFESGLRHLCATCASVRLHLNWRLFCWTQ